MMFRRLGALPGIAMALLLLASTAASAATQTVQNGTTEGSIQVTVRDNGMIGIYRFDGTDWVEQVYGGDNKYSMLFLSGSDAGMRYTTTDAASEWDPFSPYFTPVSNTTSGDGRSIVTVLAAGSSGVQLTQTVSVTGGAYIKMVWSIANQGSTTYSDLRFIDGEDTYFAGDDSGAGFWSDTQRMVYVRNTSGGTNGLMGFYTDAANSPAMYHEGDYGSNYDMMTTGTLDNTVDPEPDTDSGYSLGWTRASLAPGAAWTIEAYEKFVYSQELQVVAPSEQTAAPGDEVLYTMSISYFGTSFLDPVDLTAASEHGWPVEIRDTSNETTISSVSFDGEDTIDVIVAVTVPSGAAAGTRDLLTLTAVYIGEGTIEASDSTTTVLPGGESPPPTPAPSPTPTLNLQNGGLGNGWIGECGMVVGRDGKGPVSAMESAGMIALYFVLLLLPVGILKLVHRRKRFPFEKTGIVALFIVASMLAASSAHAVRLIAPKAQRFHPTTDGQGALTVETDQTLGQGKSNVGFTLSGAKKSLNLGDIYELQVQEVVVDELYTADLTAAYGLTPDITLGLDVPVNYSRNSLDYTEYLQGNEVRDDVFSLGDIRINAKFRVIDRGAYGLALIPFASFPSGDKDYLLSQGEFCFGIKAAGHLDVGKQWTLYGNLGLEHVGDFTSSTDPEYYTPWIQYGVGAKYLLPWRKDSIVAEVNGETSWATPFARSTISPVEFLAAYRTEVAPGWTLQAGGGGGLNKGTGAPQWRAILGIGYRM